MLQQIALAVVGLITLVFYAALYCICRVSGDCAQVEDVRTEEDVIYPPGAFKTADGNGDVVYGVAKITK